MSQSVTYLHLEPEATLPEIALPKPSRFVIIVEAEVPSEWESLVSNWIVRLGCLYLMAWGINCSSWHDSVDMANNEAFEFGEIPEDKFIMTTWHADDELAEVFWFAKNSAVHPTVELETTVLLHISTQGREHELLQAYAQA